MKVPELRLARPADVPAIERLLADEWLPPFAVREFLETFWVLDDDGEVAGSAGLEVYGRSAVIRSVVVAPALRGGRHGRRLAETALAEARRRGARTAYLFTAHAGPFFSRLGFTPCAMDDFETAARGSWQYRAMAEHPALAANVTPMRLELAGHDQ